MKVQYIVTAVKYVSTLFTWNSFLLLLRQLQTAKREGGLRLNIVQCLDRIAMPRAVFCSIYSGIYCRKLAHLP